MSHSKSEAASPARGRAVTLALGSALGILPQVSPAQDAPEEMIVTSSIVETPRRQIATAVSVIDFEDIELRGYADLADVLRTQPSIGVSNSGGPGKATSMRIRGEDAFRTLLIIDGVKAVDPSATQVGPAFDSLLTTNDLQRVEVLRGPQGFIYGADAGGVVNVITRTGEGAPSGRVGIELGEFDTRKLDGSLAGGGDKGDYFFSVTDLETDGFNAQTADTTLRDDDGADNTTLHAKLGLNATENLRLQLVARDIDASTQYDNCFTPAFATIHDCVGTTDQTTYKLSADYRSGDFANVFGYSNIDIARDNLAAGQRSFATEGDLGRFEYTGSYRPSDALTLVYGVDLQTEEVVAAGDTLERDQNAYYAEYQGRFGDSFFLSVGARHDDNDDFGEHTSTRLGAAYVQDLGGDNSLKYRASLGTGFRAPSLFEISYNLGPDAFPPAAGLALSEETSEGYDVGVEYDSAAGLHFEATYFDQEIEDEVFFDLANFSGYLQSPGTSESKGVELAVEAPLGEQWRVLGNWTNNDTSNTANQQRLRRPENLGNIGVLYASMDGGFRFAANYRLAKDAIDSSGPLPDYEVLDLSFAYSFNDTVEIAARVQNATDEDYQEVLGFNTAGRAVYAGVKVRF